jgi:adenylate kinase family enzyme
MTVQHRIFITGAAGVGKTTLARKLATGTSVPFYELDTVMWKYDGSGEQESPEIRQRSVNEIAEQPGWVVEGSYVSPAREIWRQADRVIFIDVNLRTALWRIFWRHVRAELARNNRHPGWLALFRFMKHVSLTFRSPVVGDLDSEDDGPSLTLAQLKAKADRHSDKVLTVGSSPDIDEILRHINSK